MDKYYAGVDMGGTRIKIGLVRDGVVMARRVMAARPEGGLVAALEAVAGEIEEMLATMQEEEALKLHKDDKGTTMGDAALQDTTPVGKITRDASDRGGAELAGIGMAFPGLIDPIGKRILSTNKAYPDALEVRPEEWAMQRWGVPLYIDNDARMATVGEWKHGAGQDTNDLVVMTIGTGVGTSAVVEGRVLRGKHFQAGILGGHFTIQYDGRKCNCGNIGCVEAYGSTWNLDTIVKETPGYSQSVLARGGAAGQMGAHEGDEAGDAPGARKVDLATLFDAASAGDTLAIAIRQQCLDVWSAGVINLIHAYDPEVVVLGGGVLHRADEVLPYIKAKVLPHVWCPWGEVQIRASALLGDAGILGAVYCLQNAV